MQTTSISLPYFFHSASRVNRQGTRDKGEGVRDNSQGSRVKGQGTRVKGQEPSEPQNFLTSEQTAGFSEPQNHKEREVPYLIDRFSPNVVMYGERG